MVSRYEQGLLDAPLTLERMVGWALCCEALGVAAFKELLAWPATTCRGRRPIWSPSTTCCAATAS